jgi:hypothetical protein
VSRLFGVLPRPLEHQRRLREKARTTLGDKFSLSAFHDEVIGAGALPMDVLEQRMNEWIARTAAGRGSRLVPYGSDDAAQLALSCALFLVYV